MGWIVNFSSGWGRSTCARRGALLRLEWAIEGLTKSLAQELPEGLAAVPLNPGVINTAMLQKCFGADAGSYPMAQEWAQKSGAVYSQPRREGQRPVAQRAMIGVFDSGFGGLTVLDSLVKALPQYDYLFLADSARAPTARAVST